MPSGLFALLDDVAVIAKLAAASVDDIGAAASRAGVKAAGVIIDDAAVTPRYVTDFRPERELPLIWRIAKGSLRNKLLFILPAALLLSSLLPWAVTPLLMLGGLYLCYEGAEKILHHLLHPGPADVQSAVAALGSAEHEDSMVSGAIRTDFILSAEIMIIALGEVMDQSLATRAITLAVVGVAITALVYGVVAIIVKLDDIGLSLARRGNAVVGAFGRFLLALMPRLLSALGIVGTAAMLWVGGQIILHGLHDLHLWDGGHDAETYVAALFGGAGLAAWAANAALAGFFGLIVGSAVAAAHLAWNKLGWRSA